MSEGDQPPNDSESQPRPDEAQSEREQSPTPLSVHERSKNVLKES